MSHATEAEFDAFAEDYDRHLRRGLALAGESKEHFAQGRIEWTRGRLDALGHPSRRAMDFGCGTGTSTPMLKDLLGLEQVIGVDPSEKSLELAPRGPGLSYSLIDGPSPTGVDLAFTNGVFHHIEPSERPASVSYVRDALAPGGVFALWENSPFNPGMRYGMWANPFDRDAYLARPAQLRRLLEAGGFRVLCTDFMFIFPHALRSLRGLEPRLSRWPIGAQYLVLSQKR